MLAQKQSAEDALICRACRSARIIEIESQMQRCSCCAAWSNLLKFDQAPCKALCQECHSFGCLVQGLTNKDGSAKTECGIHVAGEDEESGMSNIRK